LDEVVDASIIKTGRFPRYPPSLLWVNARDESHSAGIAKRFRALNELRTESGL
jgi:hypothetical protein